MWQVFARVLRRYVRRRTDSRIISMTCLSCKVSSHVNKAINQQLVINQIISAASLSCFDAGANGNDATGLLLFHDRTQFGGHGKKKRESEMGGTNGGAAPSDRWCYSVRRAISFIKDISGALCNGKARCLNVPVVGVASSQWSLAQLRKRAADGIRNPADR